MKTTLKTLLMLFILALGILYVDYTTNSLLGTPRVMVVDYEKKQIWQVIKNITSN